MSHGKIILRAYQTFNRGFLRASKDPSTTHLLRAQTLTHMDGPPLPPSLIRSAEEEEEE